MDIDRPALPRLLVSEGITPFVPGKGLYMSDPGMIEGLEAQEQ